MGYSFKTIMLTAFAVAMLLSVGLYGQLYYRSTRTIDVQAVEEFETRVEEADALCDKIEQLESENARLRVALKARAPPAPVQSVAPVLAEPTNKNDAESIVPNPATIDVAEAAKEQNTAVAACISTVLSEKHAPTSSILPRPVSLTTTTDGRHNVMALPVLSFADLTGNLPELVWNAHFPYLFPHALTQPTARQLSTTAFGTIHTVHVESKIVVNSPTDDYPHKENEAYHLSITDGTVEILAESTFGLMRGLVTLAQLLRWSSQCTEFGVLRDLPITIDDAPRFEFRSLMIDPPREFFSLEQVKFCIEYAALHKMNVLHWRLSDQRGFNAQIDAYPQLNSHKDKMYSTKDMRDVVQYAFLRGVRVVPEIDIPGHALSFKPLGIVASCKDEWTANLDVVNEFTYEVVSTLLTELIAIFPDPLFHLGHDEVSRKCWHMDSAMMTTARQELGLKKTDAQGVFTFLLRHWNTRFQALVSDPKSVLSSKTYIYWGDVYRFLGGDGSQFSPSNSIWETWLGYGRSPECAKDGFRVINSNLWWTYLDRMFPGTDNIPVDESILHWLVTYVRDVAFEMPVKYDGSQMGNYILPARLRQLYLGYEVNVWENPFEVYHSKVWPVLSAFAELYWSPELMLVETESVRAAFERKLHFDRWLENLHLYDGLSQPVDRSNFAYSDDKQRHAAASYLDRVDAALKKEKGSCVWQHMEFIRNGKPITPPPKYVETRQAQIVEMAQTGTLLAEEDDSFFIKVELTPEEKAAKAEAQLKFELAMEELEEKTRHQPHHHTQPVHSSG